MTVNPKPATAIERDFVFSNGESYRLRVVDFGAEGIKIELYDSRELDLLDRDRLHAVMVPNKVIREMLLWMRMNMI